MTISNDAKKVSDEIQHSLSKLEIEKKFSNLVKNAFFKTHSYHTKC